MRKIAILIGVLAICATGFAATSASETVQVKADVVEDLTLDVEHVDFGLVNRNTTVKEPKTPGEIIINGERGKSVNIRLEHANNVIGEGNSVILYGENDKESMLTFIPKVTKYGSGEEINGEGNVLLSGPLSGNKGNAIFKIAGTLNVPSEAVTGVHTGNIVVKVKYND